MYNVYIENITVGTHNMENVQINESGYQTGMELLSCVACSMHNIIGFIFSCTKIYLRRR